MPKQRNLTLSHKFYEVYQAGVFTAWRCIYDIGRGRPTNPEALVGEEVGREVEEFPNIIFAGANNCILRFPKTLVESGVRRRGHGGL
jgi:hypothetical protein